MINSHEEQVKKIGKAYKKGMKSSLTTLLDEIKESELTTFSQVMGLIHSDIVFLDDNNDG